MFDNVVNNQIKKVLREGITNKKIAGGNLTIIKEGKEIFYHEDGFSDIKKNLLIKRDSIFRLYSMSKPVTATAVMILMERGELDLYEPVSKYLIGFVNQLVDEDGQLVPVERDMNINDLLSMTSGLVYNGDNRAGKETMELFQGITSGLLNEDSMTTVEAMNKLGKCTLAFQPGTSWQYGTSADVLGAIIEVVSGMGFGEFLYKELFKPLGMSDTGFWVPEEKRERLVNIYTDSGTGELLPYTVNFVGINNQMDSKPDFESGGAGLVSTIDDYIKFATMLMDEGRFKGLQILRPRTVKYLTSGSLNATQQKNFVLSEFGFSYGKLMRVLTDTGMAGELGSQGEYGWAGWLGANFFNCPKDDLIFIIMMQKTDGAPELTRKLKNIIMSGCCE